MKQKSFFYRQIFTFIFFSIVSISTNYAQSKFSLSSAAFDNGKDIPAKFTCSGTNISPALSWANCPKGTKSFAIIMDDPDAPVGIWVHWVLYNIPSNVNNLTEDIKFEEINAKSGLNSWGEIGYRGPCPPNGVHRYIFKLYALDKALEVRESLTESQLLEEMKGHILENTELIGTFQQ